MDEHQHKMRTDTNKIIELLTTLMGGHDRVTDPSGAEVRFDPEEGYEHFEQRTRSRIQRRRSLTLRRWVSYAAVAVLLMAVGLFFHWEGSRSVRSQFADITVEAPLGSSTRLTLPDGTQVWLNAGSTLTYSQGFGVEDRSVRLTGEGYFEVTHDAEHPFSVSSQTLGVTVLGTRFDFVDFADDDVAIVALMEGSVALDNRLKPKDKPIRLTPNDRCVLDKRTGQLQVEHQTEAANMRLWTEGQLFFDEQPMREIAKVLEHSYNVHVHLVGDSIGDYKFYGEFARREQSIGEVLDVLCATGRMRYRIDGTEVWIEEQP